MKQFQEINPSPRTLMTPGPVEADPRVLRAMGAHILGQFDPEFTALMNETMEMERYVFQTKNRQTYLVDTTSRGGLETVLTGAICPGDKVLIPAFGRFGYLLAEILERCGVRDYAIVTILAYAGLRISECLALRVEDISLPAREIKVRHGKGDKMRVVYFGDKVVNAVREYLRNRPKTENPYLFPGRGDSHLTRSQVNRIFNEYSESITPHTLRHFFCSNALENGYTIADLANQAGHSNVHTTLLYTNPTREKMKEKANRL